jgi:hypothetical protein
MGATCNESREGVASTSAIFQRKRRTFCNDSLAFIGKNA